MKYTFLIFSFFLSILFVDCRSTVCGSCVETRSGDPGWVLFLFFSSSFSLFPDVTLAPMLNPPPTRPSRRPPPHLSDRPPLLTQGGWYRALHRNKPHLTPSDNPALQWPPVKGKCWAHLAPSDNSSSKLALNNKHKTEYLAMNDSSNTSRAAHEVTRRLTLARGQARSHHGRLSSILL